MKKPTHTDYEVDSRGREHSRDDPLYHVITATIYDHPVSGNVSGEICDTANLHHCLTQDDAREHLEYLVKCTEQQPQLRRAMLVLVQAWDHLQGNQRHPVKDVEQWLAQTMSPAVANIRRLLEETK